MHFLERLREVFGSILHIPEEGASPARYGILRRNLRILMSVVTILPP